MNYNREQALMNRLRIKGRLELADVVEFLEIAESTARRLFSRLEAEGKLIRIHGGKIHEAGLKKSGSNTGHESNAIIKTPTAESHMFQG